MRAAFPSLARLYFRSMYGRKTFKELKAGGPRAWLKAAGAAFLALFIVADLGFLFVYQNLAIYQALAPAGLAGLLILNAAASSAIAVFVLGFVTALSTYCLSPAEESLLALPLDPRAFLGAKFLVVYFMELVFSLFLFGASLAVFAIKESPPLLFYVYGALAALSAPLLPLALAYFALVPLMSTARFLRNKSAVMIVAGVMGLLFGLGFNLYIQSAMARIGDPGWLLAHYAGPETILARIGSAYPPSYLAWKSLSLAAGGEGLAALPYALGTPLLGIAAALGMVLLLGQAYAASILGFGESPMKRLARGGAAAYIGSGFRKSSPLMALFKREFRLMNREPIYFLNGPLIIILMPVMFALIFLVQRESFSELSSLGVLLEGSPSSELLLAAALGAFLGSATSITSTALSRDAKALPYLKALPVSAQNYLLAKLLHGLAFSALGSAVGSLALGIVLGLDPWAIAGAFAIALAFSALMDMAGLWLDTANPLLSWDNPVSAMKRNPNAVIAILGAMALIGALGFLSTLLPLGRGGFVLLYGGGSALLFCLLLVLYPRYARRRLTELES